MSKLKKKRDSTTEHKDQMNFTDNREEQGDSPPPHSLKYFIALFNELLWLIPYIVCYINLYLICVSLILFCWISM